MEISRLFDYFFLGDSESENSAMIAALEPNERIIKTHYGAHRVVVKGIIDFLDRQNSSAFLKKIPSTSPARELIARVPQRLSRLAKR